MTADVDAIGRLLLDRIKEHAGTAWDEFDAEAKGKVFLAAQDFARLQLAHVSGDAMAEREAKIVAAEVANWTFVGSSIAQRALAAAAQDVAMVLGKVLLTVAAGLV